MSLTCIRKPLNSRGLAQRLKQYEVKPAVLWFGSKQERGYTWAELSQPWKRYLPQSPAERVTGVISVTTSTVTDITDVTHLAGRREEILSRRHKCGHCQQSGETIEVSRGAANARLHRDCVDAWTRDYDERNA